MMVNCVCQLDWVMGCPDIWSGITLVVFMRVLLHEINIYIRKTSKVDFPP